MYDVFVQGACDVTAVLRARSVDVHWGRARWAGVRPACTRLPLGAALRTPGLTEPLDVYSRVRVSPCGRMLLLSTTREPARLFFI